MIGKRLEPKLLTTWNPHHPNYSLFGRLFSLFGWCTRTTHYLEPKLLFYLVPRLLAHSDLEAKVQSCTQNPNTDLKPKYALVYL